MKGFGVWLQPVSENTTPSNIEKLGEINTLDQLLEDGNSMLSCGGQTSSTGPRYADDNMGMLWMYTAEAAFLISEILRTNIKDQDLKFNTGFEPSWYEDLNSQNFEFVTVLRNKMREELSIRQDITDSQIETALRQYIMETSNNNPSTTAFKNWLLKNRDWL